jgi:hypothetical protein
MKVKMQSMKRDRRNLLDLPLAIANGMRRPARQGKAGRHQDFARIIRTVEIGTGQHPNIVLVQSGLPPHRNCDMLGTNSENS